jgi:hypothetical protein
VYRRQTERAERRLRGGKEWQKQPEVREGAEMNRRTFLQEVKETAISNNTY